MSLQDLAAQARRRAIIDLLYEDSAYTLNEDVLGAALRAQGLGATLAQVRGDLLHLVHFSLITVDDSQPPWVAHLARAGVDLAMGYGGAPGVARKPL